MKRLQSRSPLLVLVAFILASFYLAACGSDAGEPNQPTEIQKNPPVHYPRMEKLSLANDVYDLFTFCDHNNRIYMSTYTNELAVVRDDPSCSTE